MPEAEHARILWKKLDLLVRDSNGDHYTGLELTVDVNTRAEFGKGLRTNYRMLDLDIYVVNLSSIMKPSQS